MIRRTLLLCPSFRGTSITYKTSPAVSLTNPHRNFSKTTTVKSPVLTRTGSAERLPVGEMAEKPRLSASLVVLLPLRQPARDGFNYRVLLLKRHEKSRSFVNAHVFPGGNIDAFDFSPEWSSLLTSNSTSSSSEPAELQALKLCAVRETFEECGLLIATSGGGDAGSEERSKWRAELSGSKRQQWRERVHGDPPSFLSLFQHLSTSPTIPPNYAPSPCNPPSASEPSPFLVIPDLSILSHHSNWVTPKLIKRRFDTHFFTTILPLDYAEELASEIISANEVEVEGGKGKQTAVTVSADGKETVSADWFTPPEATKLALSTTDSDGIILFPPQFYVISELARFKDWRDIAVNGDEKNPRTRDRNVTWFQPELAQVEDVEGDGEGGSGHVALVLPGDPYHSRTPELLASTSTSPKTSRRHRTYTGSADKPEPGTGGSPSTPEGVKKAVNQPFRILGLHRRGIDEILGDEWGDLEVGNVPESKADPVEGRAKF